MLDYYEFIEIYNNGVILRNFNLSVEGKEFYRTEQEIKYLKPGESIGLRYNENENDFEIRYIKMSHFSIDGREVYIELFSNHISYDVLSYEEFLKNLKNRLKI